MIGGGCWLREDGGWGRKGASEREGEEEEEGAGHKQLQLGIWTLLAAVRKI